jgi:hypothetical protein
MATGGLYGNSGTGALIAQPGTETPGLYGKSPNGSVVAQPGSESAGLYGNGTTFGGYYFEWFVFQTSATQPAMPTGGTWNFQTDSGTAPSGWTNAPASNPTNPVWISIALVNSRSTSPLVWSTPGVLSYSGTINGSGAPTSGIGQIGELYIQTGVTPNALWFKSGSTTWTQITGSALYVDLTSSQTIAGTKTFSSTIQGNISGNAGTVTNGVYTDGSYVNPSWIASLAGSKITGNISGNAANVTGTVAIVNGGTGATTASGARTNLGLGTIATQDASSVAITGGSITGITDLAIADGGTGASTAGQARTNLGLGTAAVLDAGVANGVATLDAGGTVPLSQIPASIQGGVSYQGAWNASTNTPTLASSVGTKGYYYVVSVAGSTNLNGVTSWNIGDWAIFNGTAWEKIDNTDAVTSVNGFTGTVVLTQPDISGTVPTSRTITAGTGLTGGGDLSADRTLAIDSTVVTLAGTQTLTNKTLTSPKINEILDTNGNEILGLSPTTSATDYLTVKNGIGVGVPLHLYADGPSANIGFHIQPKGTGLVTISDGTDFNKGIRFRSSGSAASAVTLLDAVSTAGRVVTLPDATTTLVGRDTTDTLTNKTLTSPIVNTPAITGGTINNTTIGATTPSTGKFTDASVTTASGESSFNQNDTITGWIYSGNSFSITTQETAPQGLFFKPDGTKMYLNGSSGDDVNEYTLSTAWDITTATFVTTFSTAAQDNSPTDIFFKPDGLTMFIMGGANDIVYQYTLTVAWDISSASYASKSFSVTTQETSPQGLWFKSDGLVMYVVGNATDSVYQYALSTAWDVSTASYGSIFYIISAQEGNATQVNLSADGTKMWITGQSGDDIWEYSLGTSWNISTATPVNNFYTGFQETGSTGLFIDSTAPNRVYLVGTVTDAVFQYYTAANSLKLDTEKLYIDGQLSVNGNFVAGQNAYVDGALTVQGAGSINSLAVGTTTVSGTLTASTTINLSGATTSTTGLGTSATTGTLILGGAAQTGTMTIGYSTASQTTNIQAGATASGSTKTINFGTGGLSGSTTTIAIGSSASGSLGSIAIQSPTVNIGQTATQFAVTNTASAVNYVQVTGAATGGSVVLSSQGSDANVPLNLQAKGNSYINAIGWMRVGTASPNYIQLQAAGAGSSPVYTVGGSDTNIDLNLTTKGTGSHKFNTGTGEMVRVADSSGTGYVQLSGGTTPYIVAQGSTNANLSLGSNGTGTIFLRTNGGGTTQAAFTHTASAVNYVQMTGATTTTNPVITGQGSDSEVGLDLGIRTGGFNYIRQRIGSTGIIDFSLNAAGSPALKTTIASSQVNYHQLTGSATGSGPVHSVAGSDTNIDLNLTSKGTGSHVLNTGGGTQFKVLDLTSATTSINARGGVNGGNAQFGLVGTGNTDFIQYTLGTGAFRFLTNGIGVDQFRIAHTASAVNYVQITGAATGTPVAISAQGSDSNIRMNLFSKGTESIDILTSGGAVRQARFTNTASTVNWVQMTGAVTGFGPVFSAAGTDTNIPLVVQPKGTGALQAQQTDSTATGGNARGANAVDWQTLRGVASSVASGAYSVVGGGYNNSSSGFASNIAGGYANVSNNFTSFVGGGQSNTASNQGASISGGASNTASNWMATLGGGFGNTAAGALNFIGGGQANSGTTGAVITTQSATMNGTTAVTLAASNASIKVGQYIVGTSIAINTYVAAISGTSLTLSIAASGSSTSTLSFFTPHGVVVGGGNNQATGSYSFIGGGGDAGTAANRNVASGDWSVVCGGTKNTATAPGSFVGGGGTYGDGSLGGNSATSQGSSVVGGFNNVASGFISFVGGGNSNIANGQYSFIGGGAVGITRSIQGNHVFPAHNAPVSFASGASQAGLLILGKETTNATPTVLVSGGTTGGTTNQVILPNNSAYFFTGEVVAGVTGGGNTKGWTIEGVIKRGANAASTALVGTPTVTSLYADAGAATWTIAVTADTTNGGLAVTFTGQASTTIRTVCQIRTTEMTY